MKRVIWINPDTGFLAALCPNLQYEGRPEGQTDDEFIAAEASKMVPDGVEFHIVDDDDPDVSALIGSDSVTPDRYFRNALMCNDAGKPVVDIPKARAIHLAEIRRVRNVELAAKDVPWMKAVESGDTDAQATIATEKQTLRDIPATFDITTGVDTPEKLKAKWPTELPARE
jgi:hypothetical protein